jgi:hypothetical protein
VQDVAFAAFFDPDMFVGQQAVFGGVLPDGERLLVFEIGHGFVVFFYEWQR